MIISSQTSGLVIVCFFYVLKEAWFLHAVLWYLHMWCLKSVMAFLLIIWQLILLEYLLNLRTSLVFFFFALLFTLNEALFLSFSLSFVSLNKHYPLCFFYFFFMSEHRLSMPPMPLISRESNSDRTERWNEDFYEMSCWKDDQRGI